MCTRFFIDENQSDTAEIIEYTKRSELVKKFLSAGKPLVTSGEVRPTNVVPVIAPSPSGKKCVFPMKWGFTDKDHGILIYNARSESASYKPSFKELWVSRRCVIPSAFYYEWQHFEVNGRVRTGDKFAIQPRNSEVTWLCGLYRIENELPVFTILTRSSGGELSEIHDRMPVIIPRDLITQWITPQNNPSEVMPFALTEMCIERVRLCHTAI